MTVFDAAFGVVVGFEGGLSRNAADPGNWTGGRCGAGRCGGTNWGISSASYPLLDVAALTLNDAKMIYAQDFWRKIDGDALPPGLGLIVFDSAVNSGVAQAVRWLQTAVGAPADGIFGPDTLAATQKTVVAQGVDAVCAEYLAQRLTFLTRLPTWTFFGLGWARRVTRLPYQAKQIGGSA